MTGSVTAYSQFDIAGNLTKVIDARGYPTTIDYDDRFGAPDGDARSNTPPSELAGLSSFAFATKLTNALGQTVYGQYDYYLGRPVDGEDFNGVVASGYYNDVLDRPTQVRRAVATASASQSTFTYDDPNRTITITSDLNASNDNALLTKTLYDGLGRTTEMRQYESGTNYIAVQTQYDGLGRAYKTSNPFRPWQSETPVWTTTVFDGMGRISSVTTPDNAIVATSYSGNTVTVTDQAGKARKSVTDALGRLSTVYEDPAGLNYQTSYAYDVLDDLISVSQGVQTRTFVYDSVKRLSSATNPESGTVSYDYDGNGNLLHKTDVRNITATFAYDALNRLTSKSYNDNPQTATVNFFYDAQSLPAGAPTFDRGYGIGRIVAVTYGSGSAGTYRGYDAAGRVVRQYQQTDAVNYLVEATYWANSALKDETYPSVPGAGDRRIVSYTNDTAGRIGSLNSNATSYAPAASVSTIGYASHNALNTETYGNSLIHAISYNNRLQPNEIRLGTSGTPTSVVDLTYDYGTTNNNGNVLSVGYSGGGLVYTQSFGYDGGNRLTTSNENGGAGWSQTNSYDQYGNRSIVGGSLSFDPNTNRLSGWSYDAAGNLLNDAVHTYAFDAENKISKVDNVSAYVYDGEGQRVRKLLGENLRFIYDMHGQQIAEFDGASGNLKKEYIYGASGLVATVEPTAVNANGTRYTTPDHLGSPRVVTNSSASVISRHDYKPFGEEIGLVGGRTTSIGYGVIDGLRSQFTSKERDVETGLDYFGARYFASNQGRFTSPDPLLASMRPFAPQSWNRYSYVLNNPLRLIDPTGLADDDPQKKDKQPQPRPSPSQPQEQPQQPAQQPAQPASSPSLPQVPTSVAVNAPQPNTMVNIPMDGNNFFTGVGSILELTVTDQTGNAIPNVTVLESVTPSTTTQNPNPVTSPTGTIGDLVARGQQTATPLTRQQAGNVIVPILATPTTVTQTHTMLIVSPSSGVMAVATHQRTLTNVDSQSNLRPYVNPTTGRSMSNFTLTISPITVTRVPMVMCPRVF